MQLLNAGARGRVPVRLYVGQRAAAEAVRAAGGAAPQPPSRAARASSRVVGPARGDLLEHPWGFSLSALAQIFQISFFLTYMCLAVLKPTVFKLTFCVIFYVLFSVSCSSKHASNLEDFFVLPVGSKRCEASCPPAKAPRPSLCTAVAAHTRMSQKLPAEPPGPCVAYSSRAAVLRKICIFWWFCLRLLPLNQPLCPITS